MKTLFNNIDKISWMFVLLLNATVFRAMAQDEYDVLPGADRDQLFHNYLMSELDTLVVKRELSVQGSLETIEKLQARQARLRKDYLMLVGKLPEKTPLNAVVTETIARDSFNIDKVYYESRPNHHVTAHVYYPTYKSGPFPGILVTCGHYPVAKSIGLYQDLCMLLARNGFVTLIVDPLSQGERYQIKKTGTDDLSFIGESGTSAHSRLDVGATLCGSAIMAYQLWDNHRGIDYLISRPDVDTSRIGLTGSSGGGAQATYLSAYDTRIKVAAVNSYIMNEPALYNSIGPQTGSQNLSYEGLFGIDHPEYIAMFAPKPFMILCATGDFFDINGTRETWEESKLIYDKLGVPEKLGYFEYPDGHGYSQPKREAATKWFRTWFYDDTTSIVEPGYDELATDSLLVTETGQVATNFVGEKVVTDLNVELANSYIARRTAFWDDNSLNVCLDTVKSLIKFSEKFTQPTAEITGTIDRETYTIEKIQLNDGYMVPITGLLFKPKTAIGKLPAVLYVDGRGKKTDAGENGIIEKVYVDSGYIVLSIDVRGFGETMDDPAANESKHGNKEHRNSVISLYIGKTLIGQRVEDIEKSMDYLLSRDEVVPSYVKIVGVDRAGTSVLHAAALDTRFTDVEVRDTDSSWMTCIEDPTIRDMMTHEVPSAMMYYDLPDLVNAIAPRKVVYNPGPHVITNIENKNLNGNKAGLLRQNYPNPFQANTRISYSLSKPGFVSIAVFNLQGKEMTNLVNKFQTERMHHIDLNRKNMDTGSYFFTLYVDGIAVETKKMLIAD